MNILKRYGWGTGALMLLLGIAASAADINGTWTIQDLQFADKLQLSLNAVQTGGGSFSSSSAFDITQLHGLPQAQIAAPAGLLGAFELVREAGIFACEGYFKAGQGAGTFVFHPRPEVIGQMRALGFRDVDDSKLFTMAVHDVGPGFAQEIQNTGLAVTATDQLVTMKIHGVNTDFIRGILRAGYKPQSEDLVRMRIHGVTPDFADQIHHAFAASIIDDLVRVKIHGITLDFVNDVRQVYPSASLDDLVRLRIHGVTLEYIRTMQARFKNLSLEQVVTLKIHGIN